MLADASPPSASAPAVRRDVAATFVCFALSGVVAGSWFSRIPAVRDNLHADLATMGVVLLCFGLGSFASMPFGGRLNTRFGSRAVCTVASAITCVVFPAATLISSPAAFGAVLVVAGAAFGMWEVTLNVHGAAVERAAKATIMSALHGFWSGGLIVGSVLGAALASRGVGLTWHFLVTFPVVLVCNVVALRRWSEYDPVGSGGRTSEPEDPAEVADQRRRARRRVIAPAITVPIILLAAMTLCSNIGEGSAADWMALYAHDDRGFSAGRAAAVYATYTAALTVGRLAGSLVIARLGRVTTLRIAGVVAAVGVASLLLVPGVAGPFVGAAIWGLGLSVVFPAAISAAGDHGGDNAAGAIAAVATMAYGAFLLGPPLIGLIAQSYSIGTALRVVCVLALGISLLAFAAAPPGAVRRRQSPRRKVKIASSFSGRPS